MLGSYGSILLSSFAEHGVGDSHHVTTSVSQLGHDRGELRIRGFKRPLPCLRDFELGIFGTVEEDSEPRTFGRTGPAYGYRVDDSGNNVPHETGSAGCADGFGRKFRARGEVKVSRADRVQQRSRCEVGDKQDVESRSVVVIRPTVRVTARRCPKPAPFAELSIPGGESLFVVRIACPDAVPYLDQLGLGGQHIVVLPLTTRACRIAG